MTRNIFLWFHVLDRPMLFSCSLYESFLGNLVFSMIVMINIVVALGYPFSNDDEGKWNFLFSFPFTQTSSTRRGMGSWKNKYWQGIDS